MRFQKETTLLYFLLVVTDDFSLKIINFNTTSCYILICCSIYLKGRLYVLPLQKITICIILYDFTSITNTSQGA